MKGRAVVLVGNRDRAIPQALFMAHVKEEKVGGVEPDSVWDGYIRAGKDGIATNGQVWVARNKG